MVFLQLIRILLLHLVVITLTVTQSSSRSSYRRVGWGPWTGWSECSKTCGYGTAYRIRTCHRHTRSALCEGPSKQYRICIKQNCTDQSNEYRWRECAKHNHITYGRRRYTWVPYINEAAPCELSCKSVGYGYYARFNTSVADFVICNKENTAMCMGGACVESGCDGVLRSGAVLDRCGVCSGDGNTCELIKGIFTRTHLTHRGYNIVTTIPVGARSINVTELRRSRNYLALSTPRGYFLNGQMRLRSTGTVHGAGTSFTYSRSSGPHCPGDCLTAPGPLNTSLRVELIYFGRNPGIMYEYTIPRENDRSRSNPVRTETTSSRTSTRDPTLYSDAAGGSSTRRIRLVARRIPPPTYIPATGSDRRHQTTPVASTRSRNRNGSRSGRRRVSGNRRRTHHAQRERHRDGKEKSKQGRDDPNQRQDASGAATQRSGASAGRRQYYVKGENGDIQYKHYYHTNKHDNLGDVPMVQSPAGGSKSRDVTRRQPPTMVNSNDVYNDRYAEFRSSTQYKPYSSASFSSAFPKVNRKNEIIPAPRSRASGRYGTEPDSVGRSRLSGYRNDYRLYRWKISGFTPCSEPCGGGFQQTRVICVKSDSQVEVIEENCDPALTPEVTTVVCNTEPCKPSWAVSDWSACSVTCGRGLQKRSVDCKQRISPRLTIKVSSSNCPRLRPPYRQYCEMDPCFKWKVSEWGECSTQCGFGQRTRSVACVDGDGSRVSERLCRQVKPDVEEICDKGSCAQGWFHNKWSQECSAECGRGFYTRQVYCSASDGSSLDEKKCGGTKSKPREKKRCRASQPCGGQWFAGAWSKCNATCGSSATRQRDVLCIKRHGKRLNHVVKEHNCDPDSKPIAKQRCGPFPECPPQWFVKAWSQCSKSCGTGVRTREVKCVDPSFTPSADCEKAKKPSRRQSCNRQPCDDVTSTESIIKVSSTASLKDAANSSSETNSTESAKTLETVTSNSSITTTSTTSSSELQRDISPQSRRDGSGVTGSQADTSRETSGQSVCKDLDEYRRCQIVKQARMCGYEMYRKRCCRTCGPPQHNPH